MATRQLDLFPVAGPTLRDVADAIRESGLEGLPDARRKADQARYQEVRVRSAMAEARGMPFRWTLNPYRGCTHACAYCYARKYQPHLEMGIGDDFSSVILVKTNLPQVLTREVARASWERERVAIGTATDPYQPIEGHYRLTRRSIEILSAACTPFTIVTKGPMVVRDADLLAIASHRHGARVCLSVPSVDEDAWSRLEPGTAPPLQRIRAARQLLDAGVDACVMMMPLVPGISTSRSSIERTVAAIHSAGVPLNGSNVVHLDPGVREFFLSFLAREYPDLLSGYQRLYRGKYAPKAYVDEVKDVVADARRQVGTDATPRASGRPPTSGFAPWRRAD